MPLRSLLTSLLTALALCCAYAQTTATDTQTALPATANASKPTLYPTADGSKVRAAAQIAMGKAQISGIVIMHNRKGNVYGSVINEFGISAMDFVYRSSRNKVKLVSVTGMLNKWYIKRVLRHDLLQWLHRLQDGEGTYENSRRHITYTLSALNTDTNNDTQQ